ncbi:MAG: hypothetical protein ACRYGR_01155 [Janthinobacterium lividum]
MIKYFFIFVAMISLSYASETQNDLKSEILIPQSQYAKADKIEDWEVTLLKEKDNQDLSTYEIKSFVNNTFIEQININFLEIDSPSNITTITAQRYIKPYKFDCFDFDHNITTFFTKNSKFIYIISASGNIGRILSVFYELGHLPNCLIDNILLPCLKINDFRQTKFKSSKAFNQKIKGLTQEEEFAQIVSRSLDIIADLKEKQNLVVKAILYAEKYNFDCNLFLKVCNRLTFLSTVPTYDEIKLIQQYLMAKKLEEAN